MPHKSSTHHDSQKIIFSKILFYFFQYGTERILKNFHFWENSWFFWKLPLWRWFYYITSNFSPLWLTLSKIMLTTLLLAPYPQIFGPSHGPEFWKVKKWKACNNVQLLLHILYVRFQMEFLVSSLDPRWTLFLTKCAVNAAPHLFWLAAAVGRLMRTFALEPDSIWIIYRSLYLPLEKYFWSITRKH